jgi:carboxypeptidase Taq
MASAEYREFLGRVKEFSTLEQAAGILGWDERTFMQPGSAPDRARQNAAMAGILHERMTAKEMGRLIRSLKKQELSADGTVILREVERKWRLASVVPGDLVKEISRTQSMATNAWAKARAESQFEQLEPLLEKTIGLKFKLAEHVGYEDRPYDALLDEYEPNARSREVDAVFSRLKKKLVPIAARILNEPSLNGSDIPGGKHPIGGQSSFVAGLVSVMGFDMNCGRIDVSAHPFTSGACRDVRITVRYDDADPSYVVFPAMHEAGHALYEQGFAEKYFCTPLAEGVSMGIHESQSRLWENMVGRGRPFWGFYYPKFRQAFPAFKKMPVEAFYRHINTVKRSYIRTDADEVTYNLHIMLRYDVERALFDGKLKTTEIPSYWNELFEKYLGIPVPDDARGCLQDIHWAAGSFGYFPTYTLGNIYAAQLWATMRRQVPAMEESIEGGDLGVPLKWLRQNVHRHGKRYGAEELIKRVTGEKLNEEHFIRYIKEKYGPIYGINL